MSGLYEAGCWEVFAEEFPYGTLLDDVAPWRQRAETAGHAGSSGIQTHSLGDIYPLAVYGTGDGRWCVWSCLSGVTFGEFWNTSEAFAYAQRLADVASCCWRDAAAYADGQSVLNEA